MLCPACSTRASVIDTRSPRRRYLCRACDIRWSTTEMTIPGTLRASRKLKPALKDTRTWLQKIQARLAQ